MNAIVKHVWNDSNSEALSNLISSRGVYRFSPEFYNQNTSLGNRLGKGSSNMIVSNSFGKLPEIFLKDVPENASNRYIKILGRLNGHRLYRYIRREYVLNNAYIDKYKIMLPEANGTGAKVGS